MLGRDGRYRTLGRLIGSTKDITSSTEALAAVEKLAQGSAQAYAESGLGRIEADQDRIKESQERIGRSIIPLQVAVEPVRRGSRRQHVASGRLRRAVRDRLARGA